MARYDVRDYWCEREGRRIYGQLYVPRIGSGPYALVAIAHGFGGSYRDNLCYARYLAENGIASYSFDFCGGSNYSRSAGEVSEMSVRTEVRDLKMVVEGVSRLQIIDSKRILLFGESQGGFAAALAAAELGSRIKGLVMLYPELCIPEDGEKRFDTLEKVPDYFELWGMKLGKCYYKDVWGMDVISEIARYGGKVKIYHGKEDGVVSYTHTTIAGLAYKDATVRIFEHSGHGFGERQKEEVKEELVRFVETACLEIRANKMPKRKPMLRKWTQW